MIQTLTDLYRPEDSTGDVSIGLASSPCLPIKQAAAWIGAKRMNATPGHHKITGHVDYTFENEDVRIDLTGEYSEPECLRVIEIYEQEQR